MQKVQKTYTPEIKCEAVRLAQTSGSRSHRWPASWAFPIPLSISGAKNWLTAAWKRSQTVDIKQLKKRSSVNSSGRWREHDKSVTFKKTAAIFSRNQL